MRGYEKGHDLLSLYNSSLVFDGFVGIQIDSRRAYRVGLLHGTEINHFTYITSSMIEQFHGFLAAVAAPSVSIVGCCDAH